MSRRRVPLVKRVALAVAVLLSLASQVLGGPGVYGSGRTTPRTTPAPTTIVRATSAPISIAIAVEPPRPAAEPLTDGLRGPDGQVRRFAVEGGPDAIQVRSVIVRPGQSVTLVWKPAK